MEKKAADRWQKALALKIKPKEIIGVVKDMAEMHDAEDVEDEPTFPASLAILMQRYAHRRNGGDRAFCVHTRMTCLARLMTSDDPRLKGYAKDTNDPACTMARSSMFYATALCPLRVTDERIWFDPDEFFEIALHHTESEGNA